MDFLFAFLGLTILVLAGDALVRGAVNVSLRLGVSALIVSLTIVSIGTSIPELLIAIDSVISHVPGIAIGNVIGSNTANVLLVLGVPALLTGLNTGETDSQQSYILMVFATAVLVGIAFMTPITWVHGSILLALFAMFIIHSINVARFSRIAGPETDKVETILEGADPAISWWRIAFFLVLGLAGLPLGAHLLVDSSTSIARAYGLSETVIGLTLVAVGTSLPELATTIAAGFRRQADVAIGNVIGSNIANALGIIGAAAFFGNLPVSAEVLRFDIWVMAGAALLLAPFVLGKMNITRIWGAGFAGLYIVYLVFVLI